VRLVENEHSAAPTLPASGLYAVLLVLMLPSTTVDPRALARASDLVDQGLKGDPGDAVLVQKVKDVVLIGLSVRVAITVVHSLLRLNCATVSLCQALLMVGTVGVS
jgi:hypothetical protein